MGSLLVYVVIVALWVAVAIGVVAAIRWGVQSLRERERT